jgi:hypothetical protein
MQRQLRVEAATEIHLLLPKLLNIRTLLPTTTPTNTNEKVVAEEYETANSSVVINPATNP